MGCDCAKQRDKPSESAPEPIATHTTNPPVGETGVDSKVRSDVELNPFAMCRVRKLVKPLAGMYRVRADLQTGEGGKLCQAEYLGTKQQCYLKIVPKSTGKDHNAQRLSITRQIERLGQIDHPAALRIYEVMQDDDNYYLSTEQYLGGPLVSNLSSSLFRRESYLSKFASQVLSCLSHLHGLGFIHGRLSPLSLVFLNPPAIDNPRVKVTGLGDFDAVLCDVPPHIDCGHFSAPEKNYSEKADIWSLGVILYTLIIGESPFTGLNAPALKSAKKKPVVFTGAEWKGKTPQLISLLGAMLDPNPQNRPSAAQCRGYQWVKEHGEVVKAGQLGMLLRQLKLYTPGNPLKEGIMKFILGRVLREKDMGELVDMFIYIDREDGNGVISVEELMAAYKRVMSDDVAAEAAKTAMICADLNQNGMLSYTEYLFVALGEKRLLTVDNLKLTFKCFDSDTSGTVSVQELRELLHVKRTPEAEQQWRDLLATADKSRDGLIDFEEFSALMRKSL